MKNHMQKILGIAILSVLLMLGNNTKTSAQNMSVSFQVFYDNLAPYGQWIYDPQYGNVWVPNEDGNFRPYGSRGHWLMTEYGNTWVSNDPWGWAVYHYGRWTYNSYYGWIWIPGYDWAPAWVSWRYGGGYSGWAPLGPGMNVGMNYSVPLSWWIFVGPQYMYQPNCMRYWYGPSYNNRYIYNTTIVNNYYRDNRTRVQYNYGPRAEVIQQTTHRPVQVYRLSHMNRPGAASVGRGTVNIYRPTVNRESVRTAHPSRVTRAPRSIGREQPAPRRSPTRSSFHSQTRTQQPQHQINRGNGNNNPRVAPRSGTNSTPNPRSNMRTVSPTPRTNTGTQRPVTPSRTTKPQPNRVREQPRSYDRRMDNRSTPQRNVAPARNATPQRQAAPSRTRTPQRASTPQRAPAPQRQATPRRAPNPSRGSAPQRNSNNNQPSRRR